MWSGRRLLLFHPHCSRAAEEPFTFHQALAPGGRAAGATGMNQWMPYRPRGARPYKRGGGEDAGKDDYWAAHPLARLGQARIPGAGRGAPTPTPPPLHGWRGLARAPGAHCAGSWHQLGRGISITKSRSERGAARRGLCGAPGARRSRAVTGSGAPGAGGPETLGAPGPGPTAGVHASGGSAGVPDARLARGRQAVWV